MATTPAPTEKERVFLEPDDGIRGQNYVCLSFLTPNRGVLRNKDLFFFSKFLEFYQMDYRIRSMEGFVADELRGIQNVLSDIEMELANNTVTDVSAANVLRAQVDRISAARGKLAAKVAGDMEAYVKANMSDFKESSIVETYEKYMVVNRQRLDDEFHKANDFQTTMHGLKVRGVYDTYDHAVARAKALNKKDPYFNVYVADVGQWLPWDPDPEQVKDGEYQNEELNKLMKAYKEQAAQRDAFFEEEKRQKLATAAEAALKNPQSVSSVRGEADKAGRDMFSDTGDLALQRKAGADTITHG